MRAGGGKGEIRLVGRGVCGWMIVLVRHLRLMLWKDGGVADTLGMPLVCKGVVRQAVPHQSAEVHEEYQTCGLLSLPRKAYSTARARLC